jgi:hypothetical protein
LQWQIQIRDKVTKLDYPVEVYDIDLLDNLDSVNTVISDLHNKYNKKVICYFSAGSYEDWRTDYGNLGLTKDVDYGKPLKKKEGQPGNWPGEYWFNTRNDKVRTLMKTRLDKAKAQKCDAVDPDNIDGYFVEGGDDPDPSGFGLNQETAIDYVKFLAREASDRGMSMGLKNGLEIVDSVRSVVQFQVNEQCTEHQIDDTDPTKGSECGLLQGFIKPDNKPVFHIEYPDGFPNTKPTDAERKKRCFDSNAVGFSTLLKDGDLREPVDFCKP